MNKIWNKYWLGILIFLVPVLILGAKKFENIILDGDTITSTTNGDIKLDPNGTGDVVFPDLTLDRVVYINGSGELTSSDIDSTELALLDGVSSLVTGSSTTIFTNKTIDADGTGNNISNIDDGEIKSSAGIQVSKLEALTADRVLVTDGSGFMSASGVTETTLSYLDISSSLTSILGNKADVDSPNFTGNVGLANQGTLDLYEDTGNGSNYLRFQAPASVSSNVTFTLPDGDGDSGQALKTNGSGTLEWGDASGGGGTDTLFFSDRTADDTSNLVGYDDALQVPDNMTGGTATNFTVTSETTNFLEGEASYKISKAAVDAQGEGRKWCTDVTFDARIKAGKPVTVYFEYNTSANYVSDDVKVYYTSDSTYTTPVELVGTNAFEQRSNALKANENNRGQFESLVTLGSSDTELCIGLHVDSTNASAYDIILDQLIVGFTKASRGPPLTNWKEFTPTYGSPLGTVTHTFGRYRQVGDTLEMRGKFTTGTVTVGVGTIGLPTGLTVDVDATSSRGQWTAAVGSTADFGRGTLILVDGATNVSMAEDFSTAASSGSGLSSGNANVILSSSTVYSYEVSIPITEWEGSGTSVNDTQIDFDQPVVKIVPSSTPNNTIDTSNRVMTFASSSSEDFDTHNLFNHATGVLKAPVTGYYTYNIWVEVGPSGTVSQPWCRLWAQSDSDAGNHVTLRQEETSTSKIFYFNGASEVYAEAGEDIELYSDCSTTMAWSAGLQGSGFSVKINPAKRGTGGRPGYNLKAIQTYTSGATWTRPEGVRAVRVRVIGGGGGAGGCNSSAAQGTVSGGGGGAGYCEEFITLADGLGETETVTVGSGGAGGTTSGTNGSVGGDSSFGSHCTGGGGDYGEPRTSGTSMVRSGQPGTGGSASGGDINYQGESADYGLRLAAATFIGSNGGSAANGGGGGLSSSAAGNGNSGGSYGGGGGGCSSYNNTDTTGGAGASGLVIVEEYY